MLGVRTGTSCGSNKALEPGRAVVDAGR